ncbi:unnamed protein product [Closterium sp. NIES-65]|nr:unnamed protein product [Closterium sp. NIES-65]
MDCVVIGPGLGRDSLLQECVADIMSAARQARIPMVIDADGLHLVSNQPHLIAGYPLAILTPNVNDLGRVTIVQKGAADGISDGNAGTILRVSRALPLRPFAHLSNSLGSFATPPVFECGLFGSPRRCGGQGDVLSGSIAVFFVWARKWQQRLQEEQQQGGGSSDAEMQQLVAEQLSDNPAVMAAFAGSLVVRRAAADAFAKHKRSMTTTNIIECLGDW